MSHLITNSLLVGFFGDLALQSLITPQKDYGLSGYFQQHGKLESAFIAAGMMASLNWVYVKLVVPDPITFIAYGGVLDILFRRYHTAIMPSLSGYYSAMSPAMSVIWGMIPQAIVLAL